ncbi:hypothetical protein ACJDU8_15680 [Clostridium sp. WILCCON 0269]|uniref:Uncharacterized protein n=1 Tax=Candidatus Clostridium eludens TaxID=3381663 RepID=A0ABW8SLR8_9CLOT
MNEKEFDRKLEAEKWLYNYKSIKAGIESLKEEYTVLNDDGCGIEHIDSKLDLLNNRIKIMRRKIDQIDRALNSLSKVEREVITYACIDGMYYYEFTYKVYKSERQCKRIKKRALDKIAIALGL